VRGNASSSSAGAVADLPAPSPARAPAAPGPPPRRRPLHGERWALAQFAFSALAAAALVLVLALVAYERAGRAEAIANAEEVTRVAARGVIAPELDAAVLAGDRAALARLDRRIRSTLLGEPVLRVVVHRSDGSVLYSSEPGSDARAGDDPLLRRALRTRASVSRTGPPQEPGVDLPADVEVLDVYQPVSAPSGERLVVKVCRRLAAVSADSRRLLDQFTPYLVGGVLLLQLINLPLVVALVRRIRRARRHDELLLQREIVTSDRERRRLATDLHNGVVQEMAGLSMSLAAARSTAAARGEHETAERLGAVAADARRTTRTLRHVLVDVYPPNLQRAGLRSALEGLAEGARDRGVDVTCAVDRELVDGLGPERAGLIHRVAQEAIRNVVAHAGAGRLTLRVEREPSGDLLLDVADDGAGFAPPAPEALPCTGNVGLALMRDLVEEAGGVFTIVSAPGEGTVVRARVPL
jgi:two-component system, NarL family, sensor kinase